MKTLLVVLAASAALAVPKLLCGGAGCPLGVCPFPESSDSSASKLVSEPHGDYVEARTASVYAGACHYGGERVQDGRSAVVGWSFRGGEWEGVPLAGLAVGVVLSSDENLAEGGAPRSSVVYLPQGLAAEEAGALEAWLRSEHEELLGDVAAVKRTELQIECGGESYLLAIGEAVHLEGALLPDRECCKMPFGRWYEPLATSVHDSIVGCSDAFRVGEPALEARFGRFEHNDAFVAAFGPPESSPGA